MKIYTYSLEGVRRSPYMLIYSNKLCNLETDLQYEQKISADSHLDLKTFVVTLFIVNSFYNAHIKSTLHVHGCIIALFCLGI